MNCIIIEYCNYSILQLNVLQLMYCNYFLERLFNHLTSKVSVSIVFHYDHLCKIYLLTVNSLVQYETYIDQYEVDKKRNEKFIYVFLSSTGKIIRPQFSSVVA